MKTLVISRPIYDYVLPLEEFPQDGDNFFIENAIETITNQGTLTAITLAKFGTNVSYTGMVGEDDIARKIRDVLNSYNIDTKYIETSYTEKTCTNYKIYNQKTNKFTTITSKSLKNDLTKYKYEFIPDAVIMDDGDYGANLAAINNFPNSTLVYVGNKYTKDSVVYCNKCKYIITNLQFVSNLTGVNTNLNKPKNVIQLFQKFIDVHSANLIIKLDNFDVLYCVNDEVRLIKNINKNIANKDNLYNALLCYFLINTNDIENSIKLTNKLMLESNNELDMIKNIPDYSKVRPIIDSINTENIIKDTDNEVTKNLEIDQEVNEVLEIPKVETKTNGVNEIEKL